MNSCFPDLLRRNEFMFSSQLLNFILLKFSFDAEENNYVSVGLNVSRYGSKALGFHATRGVLA